MRAIYIQVSGLVGLISFLNMMWSNAALERTLFISIGLGLAIYCTLVVGETLIQRIMMASPPPANEPDEAKITAEEAEASQTPIEASEEAGNTVPSV